MGFRGSEVQVLSPRPEYLLKSCLLLYTFPVSSFYFTCHSNSFFCLPCETLFPWGNSNSSICHSRPLICHSHESRNPASFFIETDNGVSTFDITLFECKYLSMARPLRLSFGNAFYVFFIQLTNKN